MNLNKSLLAKINNHNEPSTFKEAYKHAYWMDAMMLEYKALMKNGTWDLVLDSTAKNVIRNKWIYKINYNLEGEIKKYKSRLVAKGVTQKYGVDYEEKFSLVGNMAMVRLIHSLLASQDWKVL